MWCYQTKTLHFGFVAKEPGGDVAQCVFVYLCMCMFVCTPPKTMQGWAWGHVVEFEYCCSECFHVVAGWRRGADTSGGQWNGSLSPKQVFSPWTTCLPDARDRQRASAAYLNEVFIQGIVQAKCLCLRPDSDWILMKTSSNSRLEDDSLTVSALFCVL